MEAAAQLGAPQTTVSAKAPRIWARRVQLIAAVVARSLDMAALWASGMLLCFLVVTVFLEVALRYLFSSPLQWSTEASGYALVGFGLFAAVVSGRKSQHFAFRWAVARLPAVAAYALRQAINIGLIAFLTLVIHTSVGYLGDVREQMSPTLGISMEWPYLGVTIGAGALALLYLLEVVDALCSMRTGVRFSERERCETDAIAMLKHGPAASHIPETRNSGT